MDKITLVEYLRLALANDKHFLRSWRIANLMLLREYVYRDDYYPYIEGNSFCVNIEGTPHKIEGTDITTSLLKWSTELEVSNGFLLNIDTKLTTTFGRVLLNKIGFTDEFDNLIPYHNDEFTPNTFNKAWYSVYKAGKLPSTNALINSVSRLHLLEADAEFGVPSASIETFTTHPDMAKLRKKLKEENKDSLDNLNTQAKIDNEMIRLDKEHYEGTQAEKFLISGKVKNIARKKMFLNYGSESNIEGNPTTYIAKPLNEGVDMENMEGWVDAARAGSFARGGLTAEAGYGIKVDLRAYGHLEVTDTEDCKTKRGFRVRLEPYNYSIFEGMYLLEGKQLLEEPYLKANVGKYITVRMPSHCIEKGGYCKTCMGTIGQNKKYNIPMRVASLDNSSMQASMKAAHSVEVRSIELNLEDICT